MKRTPLKRVSTRQRERTCPWCRKTFLPKNTGEIGRWQIGRFCSRSCHRNYQKFHTEPKIFLFTCQICGTNFVRHAAHIRKFGKPKFCSRPCASAGRLRPGSTNHRGPGWRKIAEVVRERDGRRCVRCGKAEAGGRHHHVDHILPWVMVGDDPTRANDLANLATLCDACHGVKTTVTEPRLLRGDWLSLQEFYGREAMLAARTRF